MSTMSELQAALAAAATQAQQANSKFNYEVVTSFHNPCDIGLAWEPVTFVGRRRSDDTWNFNTDQVASDTTKTTNRDGKIVTVRRLNVQIQQSYTKTEDGVTEEIMRYRKVNVRLWRIDEDDPSHLEGWAYDVGKSGDDRFKRGNKYHATWIYLSDDMCEVTFTCMGLPEHKADCFCVFAEPIRDKDGKIIKLRNLPHHTEAPNDMLYFDSPQELADWVEWYEAQAPEYLWDTNHRLIEGLYELAHADAGGWDIEYRSRVAYHNKKTDTLEKGISVEHRVIVPLRGYHVFNYEYGDNVFAIRNRMLKIEDDELQALMDEEYLEGLNDFLGIR